MTENPFSSVPFESDESTDRFVLNWGLWATLKICDTGDVKTVLDIGSGHGEHARLMRHFGKEVFTNDWKTDSDFPGDILDIDFKGRQFDAVLCSHVIEHQRNVGLFLDKLISLVKDGGLISIACPRHDANRLVIGHVSVWSMHLLCYHLMQAGVDCSQAQCLEDNETTVVVRKNMIDMAAIQEARWNEANAVSGHAHSEDTTLPWHDDKRYIERYMPYTHAERTNTASERSLNWNGSFAFPLPQSTKDIAIKTRKSAAPVTLQYEAIKARAAA